MKKDKLFIFGAILLITTGWFLKSSQLDHVLFFGINHALPLASLWLGLTEFGDVLVAGCIVYVFFRNNTLHLLMGLVAGLFTHLASQHTKKFFHATRPAHTNLDQSINLFGPSIPLESYSFPSGHSMTIFMILGLLLLLKTERKLITTICLFGFSALVGISRVAVGAHWPSDVLAGFGVGLITSGLSVYLFTQLTLGAVHSRVINGLIFCLYAVFMGFALKKGTSYLGVYPWSALVYLMAGSISAGYLIWDIKARYWPSRSLKIEP